MADDEHAPSALRSDALQSADALRASAPIVSRPSATAATSNTGASTRMTRRLERPVTARKRRAERDRHLAENVARHPPSQPPFDAVDDLDDLDPAARTAYSAIATFANGKLSGAKVQVGRRARGARARFVHVENSGTDLMSSIVSIACPDSSALCQTSCTAAMPRRWAAVLQRGLESDARRTSHTERSCSATLRVLSVTSAPVCSVVFRSMSMM